MGSFLTRLELHLGVTDWTPSGLAMLGQAVSWEQLDRDSAAQINPFPLILKRSPPPPLPNIKIGFRGFHFNIRGVSGACGHDWPLSLKSLNCSREP